MLVDMFTYVNKENENELCKKYVRILLVNNMSNFFV